MNTNTTHKQINLRPLANIARKHATKSFTVGTFGMSEGYELARGCADGVVFLYFHCATQGSSFNAPATDQSIAKREAFMTAVTADLVAAGYEVAEMLPNKLKITAVAS